MQPGEQKYELKKESNRAAAKRSRLKKKNMEDHNNEIRRALQEANTKLMLENNLLRNEVQKLNMMLDLHKDCSVTVERRARAEMFGVSNFSGGNNEKTANELSSPCPQTIRKNDRLYKIVTVNPLDVNKKELLSRSQSQKTNLLHQRNVVPALLPIHDASHVTRNWDTEKCQGQVIDLSYNYSEVSPMKPVEEARKIYNYTKANEIVQAASHLTDEQSLNTKRFQPKSRRTSKRNSSEGLITSDSEELVVQGSPGFVRVTSNSISVRQPLAKKMKRFVFGKPLEGVVNPSHSSNNEDGLNSQQERLES